jgi:hypothetical protein
VALGVDPGCRDPGDDAPRAGEGSRLPQKALVVGLAVLPVLYPVAMVWAWLHRAAIRDTSRAGIAGRFSLWFPLLTTLTVFQPDLALTLKATALTVVLWSVARLAVACTGRRDPA